MTKNGCFKSKISSYFTLMEFVLNSVSHEHSGTTANIVELENFAIVNKQTKKAVKRLKCTVK